jgi:hypothetical protein
LDIFFFCATSLNVYNTFREGSTHLPESLAALEQQRSDLIAEFARLSDLRPGSVTGIVRRCGKPTCHCAQPEDPGHGPTLRLTYKVQGKTISEALPTQAAIRKAEQEIGEFRKYQELGRTFVEVNEKICRLRPVEEELPSGQEKKRPKRSKRKSGAK